MQSDRESEAQRNDRQLHELTSELRVILPGTTVIFAFLLTVPFSTRFDELRDLERSLYFVAFLATALAIVLLVGESAYHRMRGEPYDKANLVRRSTRQAIGALALISIALASVVFVVGSIVYERELAAIAASVTLGAALITWFAHPLYRRFRSSIRAEQVGEGRRPRTSEPTPSQHA